MQALKILSSQQISLNSNLRILKYAWVVLVLDRNLNAATNAFNKVLSIASPSKPKRIKTYKNEVFIVSESEK